MRPIKVQKSQKNRLVCLATTSTMELPILIFLVVLAGEILSTIGKDTITEFVRTSHPNSKKSNLIVN